MIIRCIAIDDEPMALDKLKNYIERVPFLELTALCASTSEAMTVMAETSVDAMFVDINMPDVSGMDFVRALNGGPLVVFTTAYSEYAVESYKINAVDYLLKPYGFEDFQRAAFNLKKAFQQQNQGSTAVKNDCLFLKVDYRYVRVELDDVIYVEGMNEYLKFYLKSGDPLLTHTTFKQLSGCLPENFLQVHRSYVVNMNHVREVERSIILMSNGARISISDSNKDAFMQYLQKFSIQRKTQS